MYNAYWCVYRETGKGEGLQDPRPVNEEGVEMDIGKHD